MTTPTLNNRLTSMDASFLYFEKKESTMHIGSVSLFDGEIPFEDFVAMLDSKMHLVPRYQQIVVSDPFNLGHPTWEPDPNFNIRNHIFRRQVDAPGTEAQLIELAGRIFTPMMDRKKPLWDIYLVYGLEGGRTAMIARVHHCMVDGMSGVDLSQILQSPDPAATEIGEAPRFHPRPAPTNAELLSDAINFPIIPKKPIVTVQSAECGL